MDLEALAQAFPDMTVSITLSDLLKAQESLIRKAREEERRRMEEASGELGELMTRNELLRKLKVNPTTLWRWEQEGYLTPVRIGTRVFYRTGSVERLLHAKAVTENRT